MYCTNFEDLLSNECHVQIGFVATFRDELLVTGVYFLAACSFQWIWVNAAAVFMAQCQFTLQQEGNSAGDVRMLLINTHTQTLQPVGFVEITFPRDRWQSKRSCAETFGLNFDSTDVTVLHVYFLFMFCLSLSVFLLLFYFLFESLLSCNWGLWPFRPSYKHARSSFLQILPAFAWPCFCNGSNQTK